MLVNQLYWLNEIKPEDRLLVGEKAFTLAFLKQKGYPILPGFALSTSIFREFLEIIGNSESLLADFPYSTLHLDPDNHKILQNVAQQLRQEIINTLLPPQWEEDIFKAAAKLNSPTLILRSSLTLPYPVMAGLLPSHVCKCQRDALSMGVKLVWAELFRARSLFYCQKSQIAIEQPVLAILVQPVSTAQASGKVEIEKNHTHIYATWGLGHSIVKGEVKADYYRRNRLTGEVESQQLGNKPLAYRLKTEAESIDCLETYLLSEEQQQEYSLDDASLKKLIDLTENLASQEENIGAIEWTFLLDAEGKKQLYINQSQPDFSQPQTSKPLIEQPLLKGLAASPGVAIAQTQVLPDLNQALASNVSATNPPLNLHSFPPGRILVTHSLAPHWLPLLKKAAGVVAETGGITSHAAIIARELGIPAIVGAKFATKLIQTGESVLLNGDRGFLYRLPPGKKTGENLVIPNNSPQPLSLSHSPIATQLMVNLSQPTSITSAAQLPVDGVGLLRSELMLLDLFSSQPLEEWLLSSKKLELKQHLTELIAQFAAAFSPRPIFYRCYDSQPEFLQRNQCHQVVKERGTQNYLLDPTFFDLELEAIAEVFTLGYSNVNLILPFVRSLEEFNFCRRRVEQFGLTQQASFQLWIMAEVPSVIFLLPEYVAAGVQGIAIGTNDLSTLLLGVEREMSVAGFNALHPAMLKALKHLIESAKNLGIPSSICGQAPVDYPQLIDQLIQWGITSISVESLAVEKTYQAIARAEKRLLLEAARQQKNQ